MIRSEKEKKRKKANGLESVHCCIYLFSSTEIFRSVVILFRAEGHSPAAAAARIAHEETYVLHASTQIPLSFW